MFLNYTQMYSDVLNILLVWEFLQHNANPISVYLHTTLHKLKSVSKTDLSDLHVFVVICQPNKHVFVMKQII